MVRNMRHVFPIIGLMWVTTFAFAEYDVKKDMEGFLPVGQGQCQYRGQVYVCFLLRKDGEYRIVTVDARGALSVTKVKELKPTYREDECEILWEREPERRKGLST